MPLELNPEKTEFKEFLFHTFGFSFSSTLFMICLLRILNFHLLPLNLLINALLIGFPIGGALAAVYLKPELKSFALSLSALKITAAGSIALCAVYARFSCGRPEAATLHVLLGILAVTLLMLPYFVAYGMAEFTLYRIGRKNASYRFPFIYGSFLIGAAAAWAAMNFLLPAAGLLRIILAVLMIQCGLALRIGAAGFKKRLLILELAVFAALLAVPRLDDSLVSLITANRFNKPYQTEYRAGKNGYEILSRSWTRHWYLVLAWDPGKKELVGLYDNQLEWGHRSSQNKLNLRQLPFRLAGPGSAISIIGSGGGRDVREALKNGPKEVVAIDINAELLRLLRGKFKDYIGDVYNDARVKVFGMDGRRFHEKHDETFDLIYLSNTGTFANPLKHFWGASGTLYTIEAFELFKKRLSPSGVLAVSEPLFLSEKINRIFSLMKYAGLFPVFINDGRHGLIMAGRDPGMKRRALDLMNADFRDSGIVYEPEKEKELSMERDLLTDNRLSNQMPPFASGPLLSGVVGVSMALVLAAVFLLFVKRAPGPPAKLGGLCFLIGLNFVLLENMVIFQFMRTLSVPIDAVVVGSVFFLAFTGLGNFLTATKLWKPLTAASLIISAGLFLLFLDKLPSPVILLLLAPLLTVTGALFSLIFNGNSEEKMLFIFFFDAVGAIFASFLSILATLSWGFGAYYSITIFVFAVCVLSYRLYTSAATARPGERGEALTPGRKGAAELPQV